MTKFENPTKEIEPYLMFYIAMGFLWRILSIWVEEGTQQLLIFTAVITALLVAVTLMATRKRKNWARWLLTAYIALNFLTTAYQVLFDDSVRLADNWGLVAKNFFGLLVAIFLFYGDGMKEWFRGSAIDKD